MGDGLKLYPPVEPYASGLLDVGAGNRMYWQACGNPAGVAAPDHFAAIAQP